MSLFPFINHEVEEDQVKTSVIPVEYEIDFETCKLTGRLVKGKDAIRIWVHKALLTTRYKYIIYSWDYGHEIEELIGKNYNHDFISAEVKRFIEECLSVNPYILSIDNFSCRFEGKELFCDFTVHTQFGEVSINESYTNL